ncbi:MAG: universal stress protein [Clostridia bacterium]
MIGVVLLSLEEGRDPSEAVRHATSLHRSSGVRVHLLNVRTPLPSYVTRFIAKGEVHQFYQDCGMAVLKPAMEALDAAGVPHREHVLIGPKAETIAGFARDLQCTHIIVPSGSGGLLPDLGLNLGSIGTQLRHLIGAGGCQISEVR